MDVSKLRPTTWEVREPLRYGSRHVDFYPTEADARENAERLSREKYNGIGLTVVTKSRTIYIDHDDEN